MRHFPTPQYDETLPVCQQRELIQQALLAHQVVIICGETGSGKTTQLPKICLELGFASHKWIGHTQPRRIAARTVAARIAEELKTPLGETVGYQVRFSDHTSAQTAIKLMTDGILLAEIQHDPLLTRYQVLIIDEAHERSLNIDFLLGFLKQLLPKRPDLKLIITSATIDPQRFQAFFSRDQAIPPIIEVSGRTYPVTVLYRPLQNELQDSVDLTQIQGILRAIDELWQYDTGDVLVFLASEREIRDTAEALRKHQPAHVEVLPLFARLSAAEQNRIFAAHDRLRIVLATNVAETSLTVPGIRYVIDPGTARISRYSVRTRMQRLPIEAISQAAANQRAGRCGRTQAGVCIRLYSEEDFAARPLFTDPEIQRTHLAAVILQMANIQLGSPHDFDFIEAPERRQINEGYKTLFELQAINADRNLTALGRQLARLPVDPRLGRMLLAAQPLHVLREVLVIVAALAVQDPRERPLAASDTADQQHRRFAHPDSDFLTWLIWWQWYRDASKHLSQNKMRQLCHTVFVSFVRLREWHDLHQQLQGVLSEMGLFKGQPRDLLLSSELTKTNPLEEVAKVDQHIGKIPVLADNFPSEQVHQALLTGLLDQIGCLQVDEKASTEKQRSDKRKGKLVRKTYYLGTNSRQFHIFPGSGLFKKTPKWIMAADIVETTRVFARQVAKIEPHWLEVCASHLIKHHYADPSWQKKKGCAIVKETVSLYGLPLISGRSVYYANIDAVRAREIFIQSALVNGEMQTYLALQRANQALREQLESIEAQARRRDLLVDEQQLYAWFDARLPAHVVSVSMLEKQAKRQDKNWLHLTEADLLRQDIQITAEDFPPQLRINDVVLDVNYCFEPGRAEDGMTLQVPLAALNLLSTSQLDWLVPGFWTVLAAALIKNLPKVLRRHFVPTPEYAKALTERVNFAQGDLREEVAKALSQIGGLAVQAQDIDLSTLPVHLRMRVVIIDTQGKEIGSGRDIQKLQDQYREHARGAFSALIVAPQTAHCHNPQLLVNSTNIALDGTQWAIPSVYEFVHQGVSLKGYPALQIEEDGRFSMVLDDHLLAAQVKHRATIVTLLEQALQDKCKYLAKKMPQLERMTLIFSTMGTPVALRDDLIQTALLESAFPDQLPQHHLEFAEGVARARLHVIEYANTLCGQIDDVLQHYYLANQLLNQRNIHAVAPLYQAINQQFKETLYVGFIAQTPIKWRSQLVRYMQAISKRIERYRENPARDHAAQAQIDLLRARYTQQAMQLAARHQVSPALVEFQFMIEELRVSLFAQPMKTVMPISVKRCEAYWLSISDT